jgi:hypothetical protein
MLPDSILIQETETNWKEVMDYFQGFVEALGRFQEMAPDISIDYFGPELQLVYQANLQRKKPIWVIEHLETVLTQTGTISHFVPREPEPIEPVESVEQPDGEETQSSEEAPLEPEGGMSKGDAPSSPKKDSTAKKAGELEEELG